MKSCFDFFEGQGGHSRRSNDQTGTGDPIDSVSTDAQHASTPSIVVEAPAFQPYLYPISGLSEKSGIAKAINKARKAGVLLTVPDTQPSSAALNSSQAAKSGEEYNYEKFDEANLKFLEAHLKEASNIWPHFEKQADKEWVSMGHEPYSSSIPYVHRSPEYNRHLGIYARECEKVVDLQDDVRPSKEDATNLWNLRTEAIGISPMEYDVHTAYLTHIAGTEIDENALKNLYGDLWPILTETRDQITFDELRKDQSAFEVFSRLTVAWELVKKYSARTSGTRYSQNGTGRIDDDEDENDSVLDCESDLGLEYDLCVV